MARGSNRRKLQEPQITIASTAVSSNTADSESAQSHERVTYILNITVATAGTMTLTIQTTADGTNWATLAVAETSGDTGAIGTGASVKHISSVGAIGVRTRLGFTIVTGPFAFTVDPIYEKTGSV